jgi:methylated-DNA-[protein]-cysteine S-methyltransferase
LNDLVDWRLLGEQERLALQSVQRIPFGLPLSYERLDSRLCAYERGRLIGSNPVPLLTPCHRVSRGHERPEAYVGGVERLHVLQALEAG